MVTSAISSGNRASRLPNTNASTASAPTAPSIVSTSVLVPLPVELPAESWLCPVHSVCQPGGAALVAAAARRGVTVSAPKPPPGGVKTNAKPVRPSAVTKCGSPVLA